MLEKDKRTVLMITTLEAWCHQLLYVRQLYPSDSFASSRVLRVRVKKCIHPDVAKYIEESLRHGIKRFSSGTSTVMSLLILIDPDHVAETYTMTFDKFPYEDHLSTTTKHADIVESEQCWRKLLLSVLDLGSPTSTVLGDDATFKLIFSTEYSHCDGQRCHDVINSTLEIRSSENSCDKIRPIFKGIVSPGLRFLFIASIKGPNRLDAKSTRLENGNPP